MNKTCKYTMLTLFLAVTFVFGSMEVMNLILKERERQFLSESGRVVVEAPIRAWQEQNTDEDEGSSEYFNNQRYTLSNGQIEDVINCWNERIAVTVHNPVNGQISMEEAVKVGEEWLAEMGMEESEQERDAGSYFRNAMLGVAKQNTSGEVQLESYYSFWIVNFSNQSMNAILYLNAVTGKVWGAEITLYEDLPEEIPYEKLRYFAELSGLQESDANIAVNQEGTQAIMPIDNSKIYAEMEFRHSQIGYPYTSYGDGLLDYNEESLYTENVIIVFKLTISKDY